jgi:hypothetical protein
MSHLFFKAYHLLMDCIVPSVCVTEQGIPDSEMDWKIKKYAKRCGMLTLNLY